MSSIFNNNALSHVDYVNYFKGLAENNKNILHTEADPAFVELLDSEGPFNYLDVEEFDKRIAGLKTTFMALQSFRAKLDNLENASPQYRVFGAFIICKKIANNDFDNRAVRGPAIDECHAICESILGWLLEESYQIGLQNGCMFELTGEVGNVVIRTKSTIGKRVDFQYIHGAETIIYNENDWVNPLV
jgi:hypothetical protein